MRLRQLLKVPVNKDLGYGKNTKYMIWSPVHHYWIYCIIDEPKKSRKFLLRQKVVKIGLRESAKDYIAIFLEDFGEKKNKKLHKKFVL